MPGNTGTRNRLSGPMVPGAYPWFNRVNALGLVANRPTACGWNNGLDYYATDQGSGTRYRSNGNAWTLVDGLGYVPSGTTFPATPNVTQLFLHKPTGRSILYQWDGSVWQPIISYGTMTVYVNGASGTDDLSHGTGTGANAFHTVGFAISAIPGLVGGNVTINISAATYREEVIIQGKQFTGAFTITLQGTEGTDTVGPTTATSGANGVGNGSAGFGTVTKTGATYTVNALIGKFIEITSGTGAGQIYVVHSNTATVITVTGQWGTIPDSTSVYHVFDAGTRITGSDAVADTTPVRGTCITVQNGQESINAAMLLLNYAVNYNAYSNNFANFTLTNCQLTNSGFYNALCSGNSALNFSFCYFTGGAGYDLGLADNSTGGFSNSRLNSGGNLVLNLYVTGASECAHTGQSYLGKGTLGTGPDKCVYIELVSLVYFEDYTECDGGTVDNIHIVSGSVANATLRISVAATMRSINSSGWGVLAATGGFGQGVSAITYSGNASGTFSPITAPAGGNN